MDERKNKIKNLYEDAAYLHLLHSGQKVRRDQVIIKWDE
jgi:hypothetical protein